MLILFIPMIDTVMSSADQRTRSEDRQIIIVGPQGDHSSIQSAVENASNGDRIMILKGSYDENIIIEKSLELIGEDRSNTIIKGLKYGPTITISHDQVFISNLTVMGGSDEATCLLVTANSSKISDCTIMKGMIGVLMKDSAHCIIENNTITDCNEPQTIYEDNDVYERGAIGFWRFEERTWSSNPGDIRDSSGNANHGTLIGSGKPDEGGVLGNAGIFSGRGHIDVGNNEKLDITGNLTVSAWIKTSSKNTYLGIVDKHHLVKNTPSGAIERGFSFYLTDGKIRLTIYSLENGQRSAMGSSDLRDGKWHHVAGRWDGETIKVYVDGSVVRSSNWSYGLTSSPAPLSIGARSEGWGGYMPFVGMIDEVRLYDRSLTIDEINTDRESSEDVPVISQSKMIENGVVGLWRMDYVKGAKNDHIHDSSGLDNHGRALCGASLVKEGRIAGSLSLDGYNDHVRIPDQDALNPSGDFSISSWIMTSSNSTYLAIFDKHSLVSNDSNKTIESGYSLILDKGRLRLTLYSTSHGQISVWGTNDLRDGSWHHVVGTRYGNAIGLYIDGVMEKTVNWNHSCSTNKDPAGIGRRIGGWGGYMPFEGKIDEVHFFNYSIGQNSVNDLFMGSKRGALIIKNSRSIDVLANTIRNNRHAGLVIIDSKNVSVVNNSFNENMYGNIMIDHNSHQNTLNNNDITTKRTDIPPAVDNGRKNKWDMDGRGNYWSNWATPDTDEDGIVDLAYELIGVGGSVDNYPLSRITYRDRPPVIVTSNNGYAAVGIRYEVPYKATDPDTPLNQLRWSMLTDADFLDFNSTQVLQGTPSESDLGSYWVNITVSDGTSIDWNNFTLVVRSQEMAFTRFEKAEIYLKEHDGITEVDLNELIGYGYSIPQDIHIEGGDNLIIINQENGILFLRPKNDRYGREVIVISFQSGGNKIGIELTVNILSADMTMSGLWIDVIGDLIEGNNVRLIAVLNETDIATYDEIKFLWHEAGKGYIGSGRTVDIKLPAGTHNITLTAISPNGEISFCSTEIVIIPDRLDASPMSEIALFMGVLIFILIILTVVVLMVFLSATIYRRNVEKDHRTALLPNESNLNYTSEDRIIGGQLNESISLDDVEVRAFKSDPNGTYDSTLRSRFSDEAKSNNISPAVYSMILDVLDEM